MNPDGTLDATFAATLDVAAERIVLQTDGQILIGGGFVVVNADGSLDLFFGGGAGVNGSLFDALVQPDGSIFAGGDFNAFNNVAHASLLILSDAPTAASVTVTGRVTNSNGKGSRCEFHRRAVNHFTLDII